MTSRLFVTFVVAGLLAGCEGRQTGERTVQTFSPGAVSGAFGAALSSEPGTPTIATAASDLALVVATRSHQGKLWSRVICADGRSGWTDRAFGSVTPVVVSAVDSAYSVMNRSPDDDASDSPVTMAVPKGTAGMIVGASNAVRAGEMVDLMIPPRLNRTVMPWLQLRFGELEGFAPLSWLALRPAPGREPLDAARQVGWLQQPFIGLVSDIERIDAVGAHLSMSDTVGSPSETGVARPAAGEKATLQWAYRSPDGKHRFTIEARDAVRDIAFAWPQKQLHVTVLEGSPRPVDVQLRDLDGDGEQEFVLETASTYGDGFYSALWVVRAPTGVAARPQDVQSVPLSHATGEEGGQDADFAWSVGADNRIRIEPVGVGTASEWGYLEGELRTRAK